MSDLQYYLGLGSNITPAKNLPRALELLHKYVVVETISTAWESPSVGEPGPDFLNAVVRINSALQPNDLKDRVIHPIEAQLGRVRTEDKNAPRPIDIDILVVDQQTYTDEVWIYPHLALPLAELIPDLTHPVTGETIASVADRLVRSTPIRPRPDILKGPQL